jgi:multiple sugar transport system permease protein
MQFKSYQTKKDGAIRSYDLKSNKNKAIVTAIFIICILIAVISLFPAFWVFMGSFKDIKEFTRSGKILPEKYDFSLLVTSWEKLKFMKYFINSGIVMIGYCFCAVTMNGLIAYGLAVLKPKGYKVLYALIMLCLIIPSSGSIIALYANINRIGLTGSFIPLWLGAGANAFTVILFQKFFEAIPAELLEAARLDGAGRLRMFLSIIMPLSKPIISVVIIFAINSSWSDFLMPYLLLNNSNKQTVMVHLYKLQTDTMTTNVIMIRAILFSVIPPTILFMIFQKRITDGAVGGAIKG